VRVTPRAGIDAVDGVGEDGILRVRVRATPTDGAANKAVVRIVAAALDWPPSRVSISSGATSRIKRLVVGGGDTGALESLWPGLQTRG